MKSLTTTRPMVLLMVGLPGAGKSFFATKFSELFGAPVVSYDRLNHLLFPKPEYSKEEESLIRDLMDLQTDELFKTKRTFIIDGGVNTKVSRLEINRLAKTHDYDTLVIWVQTDLASCEHRSLNRSGRRADDKYNHSLDRATFESSAKRITPPDNRESHIVISGKHTFATQARAVLRRIVTREETELKQIKRTPIPRTSRRTSKPPIV